MDRLNLLLGIAERRTGNLIEAAVLDACYEQAVIEFARTARVDELSLWGSRGGFDLVIVAVEHLLTGRKAGWVPLEDTLEAIGEVRRRVPTPLLALVTSTEYEVALLGAGADVVLPMPFEREILKSEVRKLLRLPEPVGREEPAGRRLSAAALFRGFLG